MPQSIKTFLMFEGTAEQAMNLYVSLFKGSKVNSVERYGAGEPGREGSVKVASFTLSGHEMMCIDSPAKHAFTFTPSVSLFVNCEGEEEFESAYSQLSVNGGVLMPPGNYGFSKKFAWLNDSFGVSWQLNVP